MHRRSFLSILPALACVPVAVAEPSRKLIRLSTIPGDPGFSDLVWRGKAGHISVLLNGQECRFAVTADERTGEIVRGKRDEFGELLFIDDEFVYETVYGTVELILPASLAFLRA